MDNNELVMQLNKYIDAYNPNNDSVSFLDIIKRNKDENVISLLLNYLFTKDIDCLSQLLSNSYDKDIRIDEVISVSNEVVIYDDKRIDILIQAKNDNKNILVCIENKIDSGVHDNQCSNYFKWCESEYSSYDRYYLLLKPEYNLTMPDDTHFKTITYREVYESITRTDDIYINDLLNTIKGNFMVNDMEELEKLIAVNYSIIKSATNNVESIFKRFFTEVCDKISHELNVSYEIVDSNRTFRFYRPEWWSGWRPEERDNLYYFYVEFKIEDNEFNEIVYQRSIKKYSKNVDSKISKFIRNKYPGIKPIYMGNEGYHVIEKETYIPTVELLSEEWKDDMITKTRETLKNYSSIQEEAFKIFKKEYM